MRCKLLKKRSKTKKFIKEVSKRDTKKREALARYLWHLEGLLTTNFDWQALCRLKLKYEKLDMVPKGYNYAELLLSQKKEEVKDAAANNDNLEARAGGSSRDSQRDPLNGQLNDQIFEEAPLNTETNEAREANMPAAAGDN